ncbi:winged helix-turn-helix domain-containing protein [Vibrio sp. SS-MA-C1-2]|uniref:winged helix-turn-helix domain-containing protein n=1 Tax=Vibrio sp. SS-MA-C1-2 TaxID=2908646 RepID=UPI001F201DA7|nr:winged helix-turn-helix domain-containing protein [Vibrio sp. SS-MA-C1-2]UJF18687.1 winged helix-turn-helix domain-containing protein [Vibrio sp. SS-MA-C1-2]
MIICFKQWTFTVSKNLLEYHSQDKGQISSSIELTPKESEVLHYLLQHPFELLTKDQLLDMIWPNQIVTEQSILNIMSKLRSHFKSITSGSEDNELFIKTVRKKGYIFEVYSKDIVIKPLQSLDHCEAENLMDAVIDVPRKERSHSDREPLKASLNEIGLKITDPQELNVLEYIKDESQCLTNDNNQKQEKVTPLIAKVLGSEDKDLKKRKGIIISVTALFSLSLLLISTLITMKHNSNYTIYSVENEQPLYLNNPNGLTELMVKARGETLTKARFTALYQLTQQYLSGYSQAQGKVTKQAELNIYQADNSLVMVFITPENHPLTIDIKGGIDDYQQALVKLKEKYQAVL